MMSGKITPPEPAPHKCEGRPLAEGFPRATIWTCDDCGKKFVIVHGSQYNEPYSAWRGLTDKTKNGYEP